MNSKQGKNNIFFRITINLKKPSQKTIMEFKRKEIINAVISGIIGFALVILGSSILEKDKIIGIISILIGFSSLYFIFYFAQIRNNELKIKKLEEWTESKEEIIKTLKDIVILKKVSEI